MRTFLSLTAIFEGITGVILIIAPRFIVPLLLSTPLTEAGGIISARIAGSAIVFLALNSWFSKNGHRNYGILIPLLFYNLAIIAVFIYASLTYHVNGILLWSVVLAHTMLGLWGIILIFKLFSKSSQ